MLALAWLWLWHQRDPSQGHWFQVGNQWTDAAGKASSLEMLAHLAPHGWAYARRGYWHDDGGTFSGPSWRWIELEPVFAPVETVLAALRTSEAA